MTENEPRTIRDLPDIEVIGLAVEAVEGGAYEAARGLINRELISRGIAIQAIHTVDMPVADIEALEDWIENPPPYNGWADL